MKKREQHSQFPTTRIKEISEGLPNSFPFPADAIALKVFFYILYIKFLK